MTTPQKIPTKRRSSPNRERDFFSELWEGSWTYIKTVVDVVREPVIILDKNLSVLAANDSFYRTFQTEIKDTEHQLVYKLGNGQWDIPELRRLLEEVLPHNAFFKGFKVTHTFPSIGRKVMILNAREIHYLDNTTSKKIPPIILLAMEDITEIIDIADMFAAHANRLEALYSERNDEVDRQIAELKNDIEKLNDAT
jgi:hypothetical protein